MLLIRVMVNHNSERELANTENGTAMLEEDNIGLRAEVTITDPEVVEKARNNKLVGWSFGFYSNSDEVAQGETLATRTVTDMDLVEVSILDDTRSPAYYGTSIETRNEGGMILEIRENVAEETVDAEQVAEIVADRVVKELKELLAPAKEKNERAEEKPDTVEETKPEETEEEETEATVETEATEERTIDYSEYEERLKKLIKPEQ